MSEKRQAFSLKLRDKNGHIYEPEQLRGKDATSIYDYSRASGIAQGNETEAAFIDRFQKAINIHDIGSIYMSVIDVDPGALFGGDWQRIEDQFLFCIGPSYNTTDYPEGEAAVTLTEETTPSHEHSRSGFITEASTSGSAAPIFKKRTYNNEKITSSSTGGGQSHNNIPPYTAIYMWERVKIEQEESV